MADHANISSIDTLEAFRADLIQFIEKARVALEDAEGEVRRTRSWIEDDRSGFWMRQMKHRTKMLELAEAELYNANLTRPHESHAVQKMAVAKAKRAVDEAEEKLRVLKQWRQTFDNRVTPLLRQMDPMFFIVGQQLPKGVHALAEMVKTLQQYAEKAQAPKPSATAPTPTEGGQP